MIRFVRAVLKSPAHRDADDGVFRITGEGPPASLPAADVAELTARGVLVVSGTACMAAVEARGWLRRQLAAPGDLGAQHRLDRIRPDGTTINLAESPLARLALPQSPTEPAYLQPHHVEAGERFRRLVERAHIRQRVTMSYDQSRTASGPGGAAEPGDMALDARRRLARAMAALPDECAGVVLDVCGLEKGLQLVEAERGWPRRSAKLVLRIGLDQLARHFGLEVEALGPAATRSRGWFDPEARAGVPGP